VLAAAESARPHHPSAGRMGRGAKG
jgi:hypothetical protein